MSRYATTQYNRVERVKAAVRDVHARAIAFHVSADRLSEMTTDIYRSDDYKKLTAYDRGYVRGQVDMLRQDIWQNHVVWMLGPATGPTRQVHTKWTEEMSTLCRQPGKLCGGHFWLKDGQPTTDIFTEYKPTN